MKMEIVAEIEALLMASHGLALSELINITQQKRSEVLEILDYLEEEYDKEFHGIELKNVAEKYSFFTKASYIDSVSKIKKRSINAITSSQMEILAIIAFNQPITLKEIEKFRGSASLNQTKELVSMGLIRRRRDKSKKGNPYVYVTTENFLKAVGISDISSLK
jgi:segregation and condensation protein B